ncbi:MAG: hypothetical protein VX438_18585 [Planctomycetota bacterium]|nr:hypothetical protein [Planctomycetota bacterium]
MPNQYILILLLSAFIFTNAKAQGEANLQEKDPTKPSKLIEETKKKIREVEQFDTLKTAYEKLTADKQAMESKLSGAIEKLKTDKNETEQRLQNKLAAEKQEADNRLQAKTAELTAIIDALKTENQKLKTDFQTQLSAVLKELSDLKAKKSKEAEIILPSITVKSKTISADGAIAALQIGKTTDYYRQNETTKIKTQDGSVIAMHIKSITKNLVLIEFPEIKKTLAIR